LDGTEKKRRKLAVWLPWLLIFALAIALVFQFTCKPDKPERKSIFVPKTGPKTSSGEVGSLPANHPAAQGDRIGLAVPVAVRTDAKGTAVIPIRNSGTVPELPVVKYNEKEAWRSPRFIQPGETIYAKVNFGLGRGDRGEEKYKVEAETIRENGNVGVGMAVIGKVISTN
jgi:hypothetical protein